MKMNSLSFPPQRLWKLELMYHPPWWQLRLATRTLNQRRGSGPTQVSLEGLTCQSICGQFAAPHDRPRIIITNIWEVAIALLWLLATSQDCQDNMKKLFPIYTSKPDSPSIAGNRPQDSREHTESKHLYVSVYSSKAALMSFLPPIILSLKGKMFY